MSCSGAVLSQEDFDEALKDFSPEALWGSNFAEPTSAAPGGWADVGGLTEPIKVTAIPSRWRLTGHNPAPVVEVPFPASMAPLFFVFPAAAAGS